MFEMASPEKRLIAGDIQVLHPGGESSQNSVENSSGETSEGELRRKAPGNLREISEQRNSLMVNDLVNHVVNGVVNGVVNDRTLLDGMCSRANH